MDKSTNHSDKVNEQTPATHNEELLALLPEGTEYDIPTTIRSAVAFTPLLSLTSALHVIRDLPPFSFDAPDVEFSTSISPSEAALVLSSANEQTARQAIKAMETVNLEFLQFKHHPNNLEEKFSTDNNPKLPVINKQLPFAKAILAKCCPLRSPPTLTDVTPDHRTSAVSMATTDPIRFIEMCIADCTKAETNFQSVDTWKCSSAMKRNDGRGHEKADDFDPFQGAQCDNESSTPFMLPPSLGGPRRMSLGVTPPSIARSLSAPVARPIQKNGPRLSKSAGTVKCQAAQASLTVKPVVVSIPRTSSVTTQDSCTPKRSARPQTDAAPSTKRRRISDDQKTKPKSPISANEVQVSPSPSTDGSVSSSRSEVEVIIQTTPRKMPSKIVKMHTSPSKIETGRKLNVAETGERPTSHRKRKASTIRSAEKSTGEASSSKLIDLLDDLFAAEDNLAEDTSNSALSAPAEKNTNDSVQYFTRAIRGSPPAITMAVLKKIGRYISKCAASRNMEEIGEKYFSRLLKLLEHQIRTVETVDVICSTGGTDTKVVAKENNASPTRKGSGSGIGSRQMLVEDEDDEDDESTSECENGATISGVERRIDRVLNGLEAACLAFTIMSSARLPKHLYSEDLIASCVNTARHQLSSTVFPVLEVSASANEADDELADGCQRRRIRKLLKSKSLRKSLTMQLPTACNILIQRLFDLMQQEQMADSLVVAIGYAAIVPFFVEVSSIGYGHGHAETKMMDSIRMVSLGLLRTIFAHHPTQRSWILEEILTSLIRLPTAKRNLRHYRLPDGKSIQMVSALILQLVQSCASGAVMEAAILMAEPEEVPKEVPKVNPTTKPGKTSKTGKKGKNKSKEEEVSRNTEPHPAQSKTMKFYRACKSGIDASTATSSYVFKFLLRKCGAARSLTSGSGATPSRGATGIDAEWRALLDNFVEDVLTILHAPEWPVAEVVLMVFSTFMVHFVDDKTADTQQKALAIDHLGTIAGRLKRVQTQLTPASDVNDLPIDRIPKTEITPKTSTDEIRALQKCETAVISYIEKCAMEDPSVMCAREFYLCQWGQSFATAAMSAIRRSDPEAGDEAVESWDPVAEEALMMNVSEFQRRVSGNMEGRESLPGSNPVNERLQVSHLVEHLALREPLHRSFDVLLSRILLSLDTSVVQFRTKGLKALQQVIISDPNVLGQGNVRNTIAQRMQDSSPAVRDAAIDLVGRYLAQKPDITRQYYKIISDRILDTGLNVRKRVIKLLRDIYLKSEDHLMMVDIACKLILRTGDGDANVSELANKTVLEIWFAPFAHEIFNSEDNNVQSEADAVSGSSLNSTVHRGLDLANMPTAAKKEVMARALVFVGAAGQLPVGGHEVMVQLIKQGLADKKNHHIVTQVCRYVIEVLVEHLLTLEEANSKREIVSCVGTLCIFSQACPGLLGSHIRTLQMYLKINSTSSGAAAEDQRILQYVLIIYKKVLPVVTFPNPAFLREVEQEMVGMLSRSPQLIIQAVIPCMCTIVDRSTHNFARLTKLLKTCYDKLSEEKARTDEGQPPTAQRHVMRYLLISGLLCQNFDFDKRREIIPESAMKELEHIDQNKIISAVFDLVISFTRPSVPEGVRMFALQSLGCFFLSQPSSLLRADSRKLMDDIFKSGSVAYKSQLLKIFAEFLVNEQKRKDLLDQDGSAGAVRIDREVLVGNADELGEAGVSSSLMQCYLNPILTCLLGNHKDLKAVAFEVIGHILEQGLVHPLQCMPAVVTMETDIDLAFRDKAFKLHQSLSGKHPSFIHTKYVDCVKTAYAHLKQQSREENGIVRGYLTPTLNALKCEAVLDRLYSILKEKRQWRSDFLISLVKTTFDFDLRRTTSKGIDCNYCRFVAENLGAFEYKTIEEILYVIYSANRITSVTGATILHTFQVKDKGQHEESVEVKDFEVAAKISVSVGMLLILKAYLKRCYGLSEAKCQAFSPSDPGATKDRAAVRLTNSPTAIDWQRTPFAEKPMTTNEQFQEQSSNFQRLMAEEGTFDDYDGYDSQEDATRREATTPASRRASTAKTPASRRSSKSSSKKTPRATIPSAKSSAIKGSKLGKNLPPPSTSERPAKRKKSIAKISSEDSSEEIDDSQDRDYEG